MPTSIRAIPATSPDAAALIAALDLELLERYPGTPIYGIDAERLEAEGGVFAVMFCDEVAAACGAYRILDGVPEIKRMYVRPEFRGRGLGRMVLQWLEADLARRGHERAVLEAGLNQPEAIGLYTSAGWTPTEPFGPYIGDPLSVFLEKRFGRR